MLEQYRVPEKKTKAQLGYLLRIGSLRLVLGVKHPPGMYKYICILAALVSLLRAIRLSLLLTGRPINSNGW